MNLQINNVTPTTKSVYQTITKLVVCGKQVLLGQQWTHKRTHTWTDKLQT